MLIEKKTKIYFFNNFHFTWFLIMKKLLIYIDLSFSKKRL